MSWSDWPFITSSVFSQLAIGAFISLACVILSGKLCFGQSDRVHRTMPALWLMSLNAAATRLMLNTM